MGVGLTGAAVAAAVVVMLAGGAARFVAVNVKGPPKAPTVVFCNASVGGLGAFVNVQTILAKGTRFAVGMVMTLPAKLPKLAGLPEVAELVSVQVPLDKLKFVLAASVSVTGEVMLVTEV
jgi:hypothetical protein